MMETSEHNVMQRYVEEYLVVLDTDIDRCSTELNTQLVSYPLLATYPSERMDCRLQEFVRLHHIDLVNFKNYETNRFKDHVNEQRLFQQLSSFQLTIEQVLLLLLIVTFEHSFIFFSLCSITPSNN
jgi:hypothetical protein